MIKSLFLALLSVIGPAAVSAAETVFVRDGELVSAVADPGKWTKGDKSVAASESGATLSMGSAISTGDFDFSAQLQIDRLDQNPGVIVIDEGAEIGFCRTNVPENVGKMYVRGFFFGDMTKSADAADKYVTPGKPFRFEIIRKGNFVTFAFDGKKFREMQYESALPFGKIGFRAEHGSIAVYNASLLSGDTYPLSQYTAPKDKKYDVFGDQVDIFSRGIGPYHTYRIPTLCMTGNHVLLAFSEGRRTTGTDTDDTDILLKRSLDRGFTWSSAILVHGERGDGQVTNGNCVPVYDSRTNTTWLAFCRENRRVFVTSSTDDGLTWAEPREVSDSVRQPEWKGWYATGPTHGVQMDTGRLVIPSNHGPEAHAMYSDDDGATWKTGKTVGPKTNEITMTQPVPGGPLYANARSNEGKFRRATAWSNDGGETWGPITLDEALIEPICEGSVLAIGDGKVLFSNPASVRRERMTVRLSPDGAKTWPQSLLIYEGSSSYSDLVDLGAGEYGVVFERDWYDRVTFTRFTLKDMQAAPATAATAP